MEQIIYERFYMRTYLLTLFCVLLTTTMGCVFISEPDVGAADNGPGFINDDGSPDPLGGEPGLLPPDRDNEGETGAVGGSMSGEEPQPNGADAGLAEAQDAEVIVEEDATLPSVDMDVIQPADADLPEADADLSTQPDMTVPDLTECGTLGCDDVGYCDDAERPDCWIGDQPACYAFNTPDDTNLDAYARCCGHLGSCGPAGQWCEPERAAACWLLSDGPLCYLNPNDPVSQHLCDGRSRR